MMRRSIMRKLTAIVFATVFGVSAGLGSWTAWVRVPTVPYCTVAKNPDWYHERVVRVRAKIFFRGEEISVSEDCDPVEALMAHVEFPNAGSRAGSLWGPLVYDGGEPGLKTADAIIEGEFNGRYSSGCWGPKYHIAARNIELISAVKDYVPTPADGPVTRVKH
jgi:hypothetical protein